MPEEPVGFHTIRLKHDADGVYSLSGIRTTDQEKIVIGCGKLTEDSVAAALCSISNALLSLQTFLGCTCKHDRTLGRPAPEEHFFEHRERPFNIPPDSAFGPVC